MKKTSPHIRIGRRALFYAALLVCSMFLPTIHIGFVPSLSSDIVPATPELVFNFSYNDAISSTGAPSSATGVAGQAGIGGIITLLKTVGGGATGAAAGAALIPMVFTTFFISLMIVITGFYLYYSKRILGKLSRMLAGFVTSLAAVANTAAGMGGGALNTGISKTVDSLAPKKTAKDLADRSKRQVDENTLTGVPQTTSVTLSTQSPAPATAPPRHTSKALAGRGRKNSF